MIATFNGVRFRHGEINAFWSVQEGPGCNGKQFVADIYI